MVTKILSFDWKSGLELAVGYGEYANPFIHPCGIRGRKEENTKTPFDQEISELPTTVQVGEVGDLLTKHVFIGWWMRPVYMYTGVEILPLLRTMLAEDMGFERKNQ